MTAKEFLDEKLNLPNAYINNNKLYTKDEVFELSELIEEYHQAKLKLLGMGDVVGRSEQLKAFNEVFQIAWELVQDESDYTRLLKIKESL